jgi:hypothetical protein
LASLVAAQQNNRAAETVIHFITSLLLVPSLLHYEREELRSFIRSGESASPGGGVLVSHKLEWLTLLAIRRGQGRQVTENGEITLDEENSGERNNGIDFRETLRLIT